MKLSVIIVNYNVEYFLEQCLNSVMIAFKHIEGEVIVVDNNSIDSSCAMVKKKFPQSILIENKKNAGFSKANNQGINIAKGEYVLLLNPDTVVEEDTFKKVCDFMDQHADAGGLGVKMIDGKGKFLPESKRGLPTPSVAFYKIFGISTLFPKSKKFGRYHLGYLDKDKTNEIEILSGAFMLLRKKVLDQIGLLDEAFFMYGEDIDLSYRIILGGYKNFYFPEARIIHYKGESTKKSSVNYVFVFYNAMIIFAKKHFSEKNAKTFSFLINVAIYLRASAAIITRFIKKAALPLLDFLIIFTGLIVLAKQYEFYRDIDFPDSLLYYALPSYTLTWIISVWLSGGFDKPIKLLKIIQGLLIGTAVILMVYALLPKEYQFSRFFILLGTGLCLVWMMFSRIALHFSGLKAYHLLPGKNKRFIIVGKRDEAERVAELLRQTSNFAGFIAYVSPDNEEKDLFYSGSIEQLNDVVDVLKIDEVIFCARDNSAQQIIDKMSKTENRKIDFKIAQPESLYLIGSNSINTSGDLYVLDINSVTKPKNKRNKRLFDFFSSLVTLSFSPVLLLVNYHLISSFPTFISVLFGRKTVVSYSLNNPSFYSLPAIKKGIISTSSNLNHKQLNQDLMHKIDIIYAKDYRLSTDLKLWFHFLLSYKKIKNA